jgi:thioredoxin-related protein
MTGLFRIFAWLLLVQFWHIPVALSGEYFDDSAVLHIDYPQWFRDSPFTDLSEDLEYAVSENKKGLMVLFTTQGCSYCDIFIKQTLGDESIASVVRDNFESIGMEIFDDKEMTAPWGDAMPIKVFAHREKVEYSPTLLFYDKDGQLVMRAVGYQSTERFRHMLTYVIDEHYRSVAFRDYLKQKIAQSCRSQRMKILYRIRSLSSRLMRWIEVVLLQKNH